MKMPRDPLEVQGIETYFLSLVKKILVSSTDVIKLIRRRWPRSAICASSNISSHCVLYTRACPAQQDRQLTPSHGPARRTVMKQRSTSEVGREAGGCWGCCNQEPWLVAEMGSFEVTFPASSPALGTNDRAIGLLTPPSG